MSFTDIKTKSQGFTIVELLIVVVVIAILAAITIVSYTGITNRANGAGAQETASNVQKKVEAYAADSTAGNYTKAINDLTASGNSWTLPASAFTTSPVNAAPTASNGSNTVQYRVCGRANTGTTPVAAPTTLAGITVITGFQIGYWDYTAATPTVNYTSTTGGQSSGSVTVGSVVYNIGCVAASANGS